MKVLSLSGENVLDGDFTIARGKMKRRRFKDPSQDEIFSQEDRRIMVRAREKAIEIAYKDGTVSADKLREEFQDIHAMHTKAIGSIFKVKKIFIASGFKNSTSNSRKGGAIRIYRITDEVRRQKARQYGVLAEK